MDLSVGPDSRVVMAGRLDAPGSGRFARWPAFERTTLFGARVVAVELVANGRTLATEGQLRLSVLQRLRVRLRERQQPAR